MVHDIILGDFGRSSAISFISQCDDLERSVISSRLRNSSDFRDEHRRWTFELLCDVVSFKGLTNSAMEFDAMPRSVLLGFGLSDSNTLANIRNQLQRRIDSLSDSQQRSVRVVVPCNTLGQLSLNLELRAKDSAGRPRKVEVLTPPHAVMRTLSGRVRPCLFMPLGTPAAVDYYANIYTQYDRLKCILPSPKLLRTMSSLIELSIAGLPSSAKLAEEISAAAAMELFASAQSGESIAVVSGCTDVRIPGAVDSLAELAVSVIETAYARISPTGKEK